ncbi:TonB-dependent receptor [Pontibacter sp. E15-1]|uniref:SusC/RagA family TonB-linked outer membrane protein n=1 Tax=Pontibacter sp. E15-1 TaxID=2919918 RepID=UPI001F4F5601|nr:TonB-dependent receptor [Pontibacter sp. E15-1]MCJ8164302.1 TonB-dependent receptor [Pontibacter sp. E15-1]
MKVAIKLNFVFFRKVLLVGGGCCAFWAGSQAQTTDLGIDGMATVAQTDTLAQDSISPVFGKYLRRGVVNVAYGKQPYVGSTAAIATISGGEMRKTLTPSLSNTLYGRLPGLTVLQGSGEPGYDEPSLLIRGLSTCNNAGFLVMVDGFEASFDQLNVEEIESVSVLKDAAALALYGIRGANGAILVTTKRGQAGKSEITFNARTGLQQPTRLPEFLGAYDYGRLYNEALANDGLPQRYTDEDLAAYQTGSDPFLHPDVNWYDEVLRESAPISDYSFTFSGGSKAARYFVLLGYMQNEGLYARTDKQRKENSNADFRKYNFRTNLDVDLNSKITASLDLGGRIEDRSFPNYNGLALWDNMARYPANAFPVRNPDGSWGGNSVYPDNPVATVLDRGLNTSHDRNLMATLRLSEDLSSLAKGLTFRQALSVNNWHRGNYNKTRNYTYNELIKGITSDGRDTLIYRQRGTDSDFSVDEGGNDQWNRFNVQAALDYTRQFGNHGVDAMVMYHQDVYDVSGNNVPYAQQSVMGRLNFNYKSRYFTELGFAYSGSERFPKGNRFGFFPALSAAWVVSNEDFLQQNATLSFLKARASVGLVGSDRLIGNRFAYVQDYYYSGDYRFGNENTAIGTIMEGTLGNPDITWEKALKYNVGFDGSIRNKLDFTLDLFYEKRTDILASAAATIPAYIGVGAPYQNVGEVLNRGFEINVTYRDQIGDFGYFVGASSSFARNKIVEMNEVTRAEDYLYRTGHAVGQLFGLEAVGFYNTGDFQENGMLNPALPVSTFAPVQPGDIRYRDQNNDGFIDENDEIAIGKPSYPELTYTANLGAQFKGFDVEVFFQGIANRDVYLNGSYFWAFVDDANIAANALGRWTPDNAATATYPRLTTLPNANNYRPSTSWMRSGSALRLRNVEVGYTLPGAIADKVRLSNARIFASGFNLFTWDEVDAMDPVSLSGYPPLKSYTLGVRLQF